MSRRTKYNKRVKECSETRTMNVFEKFYAKLQRFFPRQWRRIVFVWQYIHSEKHPYVKLAEYAEAFPDKVEILKRTVQTMSYKVPVYWGEMDTSYQMKDAIQQ